MYLRFFAMIYSIIIFIYKIKEYFNLSDKYYIFLSDHKLNDEMEHINFHDDWKSWLLYNKILLTVLMNVYEKYKIKAFNINLVKNVINK